MGEKKPVEWEDILPKRSDVKMDDMMNQDDCHFIFNRTFMQAKFNLEKAERSGLICRNVPTESEIENIVIEADKQHDEEMASDNMSCPFETLVAKSISARLRGEHPDLLKGEK